MDQTQDNLTPKRILVELRRLRRIHDVTMYSFSQTRGHLEERLARREINGKTPIMSEIADEERMIANSPLELLPQLSNVYPQILRESHS